MALKIRFQRKGRRNSPVLRMVVAESSAPRDGRFVENLGVYNQIARGQDPEYRVAIERIEHWLKMGAKPTVTAQGLIRRARKQTPDEKGMAQSFMASVTA